MIQHTVTFRLHPTVDEAAFPARARRLGELDGVGRFEVLRQVGRKNDFTHALSMWFPTQDEYDAYNAHPDHVAFVSDVWLRDVADFLELDDVSFPTPVQ
jgi:hypothetical protein